MSRTDKLLEIIRGVIGAFSLPENINDNNISVDLSLVKQEKVVEYHDHRIVIQADTPQGQQIAAEILAKSHELLDKGERIVEADLGKLIAESTPFAQTPEEDKLALREIKPFVPESDIPIVEAALFLRRLSQNGVSVSRQKMLINQKYGPRGNNIANLIGTGYYEGYLLPIYQFLATTEGERASQIFSDIYEQAVTQYPFAVFVSENIDYESLKKQVNGKIQINLLNDQHVLNIHGKGAGNKKKILRLMRDEELCQSFMSEPDIVELEKTIYARIHF